MSDQNQIVNDDTEPIFAPISEAIEAIRRGEIVVVVDDEDRENEGDLIMAAEAATTEKVAFFVKHTSGVICVALTGERCDDLGLPLMVADNTEYQLTAFTHSVDYRHGTTTGISAGDRTATMVNLADPNVVWSDFNRPGHIFPLRARDGGVLKRAGHTEAAVDLAKLAGLNPAGTLCEIVNDDGTMARVPELRVFAKKHNLLMISIADLVKYRRSHEMLVEATGQARVPTRYGTFVAHAYRSVLDGTEHVAFVYGEISSDEPVLVRVHSECLTGDIFGSLRCDCGPQLHAAMEQIAQEGKGVLVYLRGHEGRGIGLGHKLRAYGLQDSGQDTVDANLSLGLPVDSREYGIGAQILADLGVQKLRVLTNNPAKYGGLQGFGLEIVERVSIQSKPNPENIRYLRTKQERLGHLLEGLDDEPESNATSRPTVGTGSD